LPSGQEDSLKKVFSAFLGNFKKLASNVQTSFYKGQNRLLIELHKYARPGLGRAFLFYNHHYQMKDIPEQIALSCLPVLSMDENIL